MPSLHQQKQRQSIESTRMCALLPGRVGIVVRIDREQLHDGDGAVWAPREHVCECAAAVDGELERHLLSVGRGGCSRAAPSLTAREEEAG